MNPHKTLKAKSGVSGIVVVVVVVVYLQFTTIRNEQNIYNVIDNIECELRDQCSNELLSSHWPLKKKN